MRAMNLHSIKTRLLRKRGARSKLIYKIMYFFNRKLSRGFGHRRLPQSRRSHNLFTGHRTRRLAPRMVNLRCDFATSGMDSVDEFLVRSSQLSAIQTRQAVKTTSMRANNVVLSNNEAPATARLVLMVGNVFLGRHSV